MNNNTSRPKLSPKLEEYMLQRRRTLGSRWRRKGVQPRRQPRRPKSPPKPSPEEEEIFSECAKILDAMKTSKSYFFIVRGFVSIVTLVKKGERTLPPAGSTRLKLKVKTELLQICNVISNKMPPASRSRVEKMKEYANSL